MEIDQNNLTLLVKNALRLIEENYLTYHYVRHIANDLAVTEETLCREFKKQCGVSCKKLLTFLKVRHAAELMRDSKLRINEIAYQTGFSNDKRFGECFKKLTGYAPGEYRRNVRRQAEEEFWQEILCKIVPDQKNGIKKG